MTSATKEASRPTARETRPAISVRGQQIAPIGVGAEQEQIFLQGDLQPKSAALILRRRDARRAKDIGARENLQRLRVDRALARQRDLELCAVLPQRFDADAQTLRDVQGCEARLFERSDASRKKEAPAHNRDRRDRKDARRAIGPKTQASAMSARRARLKGTPLPADLTGAQSGQGVAHCGLASAILGSSQA